MSRPQYQYQAGPHVVNGGLIDFRDNFNTGNPEYPTTQCMYPVGPVPGMQAPASLPGFHPQGLGCVSGPPSYMHINGVMYRPVDDSLGAEASAKAAPKPAEPVATKEEPVKVLSEAELERSIDDRVRQRVEEFLSTQRHNRPRGVRHTRDPDPDPRRYAPPEDELPELDSRAVQDEVNRRIKKLNASMPMSAGKAVRRG